MELATVGLIVKKLGVGGGKAREERVGSVADMDIAMGSKIWVCGEAKAVVFIQLG